jgi:hypothetical protein
MLRATVRSLYLEVHIETCWRRADAEECLVVRAAIALHVEVGIRASDVGVA